MEYKAELKLLRQRVPVSITEALQILKANQGNIVLSEKQFIEQSINTICIQTGCRREVAIERFATYKYDLTKAVSSIKEQQYNLSYVQPAGVTAEKLRLVVKWLELETCETFDFALDYEFDRLIEVLEHIPTLHRFADILKGAKARQQTIFNRCSQRHHKDVYTYSRNKLIRDAAFKKYQEMFELSKFFLEEEINRHLRNIIILQNKAEKL